MLLDANIFMYAAGRESPQRAPCREFLRSLVEEEESSACTNTEALQEILHRYRALGTPEIGFAMVDSIVCLPIPILPIAEADVLEARRLMEAHPGVSARDAVHLGMMRQNDIEKILSYDRGFSQVPWAIRREP